MTKLTARELLLLLYQSALDAVDGRFLVNQWFRQQTDARKYTHCVAIGKAAAAMMQGAHDCVPSLKNSLLICPPEKITRALKKHKNLRCLAAAHPVPDESSIAAAEGLLEFLSAMQESDELLFLVSGGTSSLVEMPVAGVSLEQLQQINRYLLSSGKNIHQINAWRQQFSAIKGGGLLSRVRSQSVTQLLLSDVKDDRAEFIGSGLLIACAATTDADDYLSKLLPPVSAMPETRAPVTRVDTFIIGNIKMAMQAVDQVALDEGLDSFIHDEFLDGDAVETAAYLYRQLKDAPPGIHIWGGETTVLLPEKPGVGGRNQTLALAFAEQLTDTPGLHLLAAGTDGVDGNSRCAGAVVSMYTLKKARSMGFDSRTEIKKANAGMLLMATDDLVPGGQSNTNVMDIIIAYKQ